MEYDYAKSLSQIKRKEEIIIRLEKEKSLALEQNNLDLVSSIQSHIDDIKTGKMSILPSKNSRITSIYQQTPYPLKKREDVMNKLEQIKQKAELIDDEETIRKMEFYQEALLNGKAKPHLQLINKKDK